jgi:chromatin structure-remodeling complex protein RSC7
VDGVYDAHTNAMFYPKITQPTHAKWEEVPATSSGVFDYHTNSYITNGVAELTNGVQDVSLEKSTVEHKNETIFTPVPPIVSRNYLVVDTYLSSAPVTGMGIPGPDGDFYDTGVNGLPDVHEDILAELPMECRQALEDAKRSEREWKNQFSTEMVDGLRTKLKIGFSGVPV